MQRFAITLTSVLLAAALLLPSCRGSSIMEAVPPGSAGAAAWSMAGGGPDRQGHTALVGPLSGDVRWAFDLGGRIEEAPAFGPDGTIYVAQGRVLSAVSRQGEELWRYSCGREIVAPPHLDADGLIWAVSGGVSIPYTTGGGTPGYTTGGGLTQMPQASQAAGALPALAPILPHATSAAANGAIHVVNPDGTLSNSFALDDAKPLLAVFAADGSIYAIVDTPYTEHALVGIDTSGIEQWRETLSDYRYYSGLATAADFIYFVHEGTLHIFNTDGSRLTEMALAEDDSRAYAVDSLGNIYLADVSNRVDVATGLTAYSPHGIPLWEAELNLTGGQSVPLIAWNDVLYIADGGHTLHAISSNGDIIWSYPDAGYIVGIAPDGAVYSVRYKDYAYTTNVITPDGELRASMLDFPRIASGFPSISLYIPELPFGFSGDGLLLACGEMYHNEQSYREGVHALDDEGNVLWSMPSVRSTYLGPVVDSQGNYYLSNEYYLFALDPAGNFLWSRASLNSYDYQPILLPNGNILACNTAHQLSCYTPAGALAWQAGLGGWGDVYGIAATRSRIYVTSGFLLYCVDFSGETKYLVPTETNIRIAPAIATDGTAYVIDTGGTCYAVSPDGQELWRYNTEGGYYWEHPVVAYEGTILFPAEHGLVALHPDGSEYWRFTVGTPRAYSITPAVGGDGTIYLPLTTPQTEEGEANTQGIYALSPAGATLWMLPLETSIRRQPLVDGAGNIYMQNIHSEIIVVSPAGTALVAEGQEEPPFTSVTSSGYGTSSPCIAPDGALLGFDYGFLVSTGP